MIKFIPVFNTSDSVYVGEFNTGRVMLPVEGCCNREVVVVKFFLFRKAERYAPVFFEKSGHESLHGLPDSIQLLVDKSIFDSEQV